MKKMKKGLAPLSFEEKFIKEINSCRHNPQKYSLKIRSYKEKIDGDCLRIPNSNPIKLQEGVEAFEELAMFLDNLDCLPEISYSEGLSKVCADLQLKIEEYTKKEDPVFLGIDKTLARYGEVYGPFSQHIEYYLDVPEIIVVLLLVDDGDENRTNRMNLLNFSYKYIGVDHRPHKYFSFSTIFILARHFYSLIEKPVNDFSSSDEDFDNYSVNSEDKNYFTEKIGSDFEQKENISQENGTTIKFIKVMKVKEGILYTKIFRDENVNQYLEDDKNSSSISVSHSYKSDND